MNASQAVVTQHPAAHGRIVADRGYNSGNDRKGRERIWVQGQTNNALVHS